MAVIPFTKENAAEMAKRARESRKRNAEMKRAFEREQATAKSVNGVERAVQGQVERLIERLGNAKTNKEIARLSLALERLWNMVYPKAGSRKPGRSDARRSMPQPSDSWQPIATEVATELHDKPIGQ